MAAEVIGGDPVTQDLVISTLVVAVRGVIRIWSEWRDGAVPTSEEATQAVIFDGEHDSYQPLA